MTAPTPGTPASPLRAIAEAERIVHDLGIPNGRLRVVTGHVERIMAAARQEGRAERDAESDALRTRLANLLTDTANALKGDPGPLRAHDWSDLPRVAAELRAELMAAERRGAEALAVLRELVRLKDGPRDTAYERAKPKAWDAARRLLGAPGSRSVDSLITRLDNALERAETERLALCDERRHLLAETEHLRAEAAAAEQRGAERVLSELLDDLHDHATGNVGDGCWDLHDRWADRYVTARAAAVAVPDTTTEGDPS